MVQISPQKVTFKDRILNARAARCQTAICWGDKYFWGLEPLAELPVGKAFAMDGSSLGKFINSHDVSLQLTAGIRIWTAWDWISLSIYIAKPLLTDGATIRVNGTDVSHPEADVRTPYPSLAIGLLADTIWIGFDIYELHNGDLDTNRDLAFPRNDVISRSVTLTLGIAPINLVRTGIGLVSSAAKADAAAEQAPVKKKQ